MLCDNEEFFRDFERAFEKSGERYLRFPIYREYERMIESEIADIKNLGDKFAGSITAGLFIRSFAEQTPWIHLDIAGTAWVEPPVFEYQSKGASGAGLTTMYYLCAGDRK
jgi:leucyl aminopeptidase